MSTPGSGISSHQQEASIDLTQDSGGPQKSITSPTTSGNPPQQPGSGPGPHAQQSLQDPLHAVPSLVQRQNGIYDTPQGQSVEPARGQNEDPETQKAEVSMTGVDEDEIYSDDEEDERVEKEERAKAKAKHKERFSFVRPDHRLYVDVIANVLNNGDNNGKTLHDIFQLNDINNVKIFQQNYESKAHIIDKTVKEQQQHDFTASIEELRTAEVFGGESWFHERNWLTPSDWIKWKDDPLSVQRNFGIVSKVLRCFLPLHAESYRHPVNMNHDGIRAVHRDHNDIPVLPYFDHVWSAINSFWEQAEQDNQELWVFWSDRPVGITDAAWQTRMKSLCDQNRVDLRIKQNAKIATLSPEQQTLAFERRTRNLKTEEERRHEMQEGTKNYENQLHTLRNNRVEIQPRQANILPEVRAAQREIIPYMKSWWENNENELDNQRFTRANCRIRDATKDSNLLLAYSELLSAIKDFRRSLSSSETTIMGTASETEWLPSLLKLVGDAISLTNLFRKGGLDWKAVVSNDIHERFLRLMHKSEADTLVRVREHFEDSWLEPYYEQLQVLESTSSFAICFEQTTQRNSVPLKDALRTLVEQYLPLNRTLQSANDLLGIRPNDHSIPVSELEAALRNRDSQENHRYCLAAFQYKMVLLKIPGHEIMKKAINVPLTKSQEQDVRKQVLGLSLTILPGDTEAHSQYPMMSAATFTSQYSSCAEQMTEMWGGSSIGGRFFINRYGPTDIPIFRIERQAVSGHSWGSVTFPLPYQISEDNKFGHIKKYGPEHIRGIAGVAWSEDIDLTIYPDAIEYLNPIYHDRSNENYMGMYKSTYVLVIWDRFGAGPNNPTAWEYKWETRTDLRKRWLKETDRKIYEFAKESQVRFEAWRNGQPPTKSREISPYPTKSAKLGLQRSEGSLTSADRQNVTSLAASYRMIPSPQPSLSSPRIVQRQQSLERQSEGYGKFPNADSRNRVRFQGPGSTYGFRSSSEESMLAEEGISTSVETTDDIELIWNICRRKYVGDLEKQKDYMELIYGPGWRHAMMDSMRSFSLGA